MIRKLDLDGVFDGETFVGIILQQRAEIVVPNNSKSDDRCQCNLGGSALSLPPCVANENDPRGTLTFLGEAQSCAQPLCRC
jgi:hypothetical protein